MRSYPSSFFAKIMPFIGIGIFLAIFVIAFVFLSYVLLIGAVIGLALFVVAFIKQTFFSSKSKTTAVVSKRPPRTFDHDDQA